MEPRTRLAWGFGVSLVVVFLMLVVTPFEQWSTHRVLGFFIKLTLVVGALWLAWSDLVRIGKRLPPKIIILATVSLLAILIHPRFGALLLALTIVYWAGWWLYQKIFSGGRPQGRKS
ncbi:MAG: hypothetical protein Q8M16_03355 [Pirellulaceae bacterium]|nr:hypothetical protein [Pirellulaceae bacterium]